MLDFGNRVTTYSKFLSKVYLSLAARTDVVNLIQRQLGPTMVLHIPTTFYSIHDVL